MASRRWRLDRDGHQPSDLLISGLLFAVVFLAIWTAREAAELVRGLVWAVLAATVYLLRRSYRRPA